MSFPKLMLLSAAVLRAGLALPPAEAETEAESNSHWALKQNQRSLRDKGPLSTEHAWKQESLQHKPASHGWATREHVLGAPHSKAMTTMKAMSPAAREEEREEEEIDDEEAEVPAVEPDAASLHSLSSDSGLGIESLARAAKGMKLKQFLPKCEKKVRKLIAVVDYNYGDAQLETTLKNHCTQAKEFPRSHPHLKSHGFRGSGDCLEFAEDLAKARNMELKTDSTRGYSAFCTSFYDHHGGFIRSAPKKEEDDDPLIYSGAQAQRLGASLALAALTSLLLLQ